MQERKGLKTGRRPVQMNIRTFKPQEVLFEEGKLGREMFIIQEGVLGVYKNTSEGDVHLATLEKGAVVGEMSLLDNLPRSATVKAIEESKALVVNEAVFKNTLKVTPVWLTSIIKIVVSRLRDANKRVDQSALRNKEHGIVSLMLILLPEYKYEFSSMVSISHDLLIVEAYYVCSLKKKESVNLLNGLSERELVNIEEDTDHKKHVCITDIEALRLFDEYLTLKSEKKKFKEVSVPEGAVAMLSNIAYVAQKSGKVSAEGTSISKFSLIEDLSDQKEDVIEQYLLDLRRRGLINMIPSDEDVSIIFKSEILSRVKKIREWLPKFEKEV